WWEQPIVADPDHSTRSKIIFSGATNASIAGQCHGDSEMRTPPDTSIDRDAKNGFVDKIYKGVRCKDNNDCVSQKCDSGFCRCTTDQECGNTWVHDPNDIHNTDGENGLICTSAITGTPGTGNVCRMQHANINDRDRANQYFAGIKVFRDKLDR